MLPQSDDFKRIPQDPKNPITMAKVELGKLLFHDPGLSINPKFEMFNETYSCATCHHHIAGFQAGRAQGVGEGGVGFGRIGESRVKDELCPEDSLDIQPIRTPSTLNSAYQEVMLWNGQFGATGPNIGTESRWTPGTPLETNFLGYQGIETQAIAGLTVHRLGVPMELIGETEYKQMIDAAFPEIPSQERYTKITLGLAIAAYERTIIASEAPFQKYLKGNHNAMTNEQKRGAILFFGKANCVACHNGPALNSMEFYAYGMKDLQGYAVYGNDPDMNTKRGRGGFTGNEEDDCKFKTPQLYNLKMANFLGHGSSFSNVYEVVKYKNMGIKENDFVPDSHLAEAFKPLGLTETEMKYLTSFIENGLFDPNLARYEPDFVPSGFCFPNNDPESRIDLGCILP
jgi:cytochrome c peroxidase